MIGYEFLLSKIPLRMPELAKPAKVKPVTRVEDMADLIAIPKAIAPTADTILPHLLFALKHEPMQLAILHEALRLVPAQDVIDAISESPSGAYVRRAAYLWEKVHGVELELPLAGPAGNYVDFFDPKAYYTGQVWERSQKYRISFNGIGPYEFCPVVRRDDTLEREGEAILRTLREWAQAPENEPLMDRVMAWAYLSETRDSFAIENEVPSPDKERAFVAAMEHLRDRAPLTEDYLVGLQNAVISSPRSAESGFRGAQNWLQRGGHGALAVRYVPPAPEHLRPLIDGLMRMANAKDDVPALIKAALVSFGFVFIHPFMDGNGRVSRLLAHHCLHMKGALPDVKGSPAILPLSVAMKQEERQYLGALESFSKPVRALWDVMFIGDGDFTFDFRSTPMVYAHWSGVQAAAFVIRCARIALRQSLVDEARYLEAYDLAYERIDKQFDLPNRTINLLIQWIHQNNNRMPERRRTAREVAHILADEDLSRIEGIVAEAFASNEGPAERAAGAAAP
ncbi:Fic family protein [Verminephrobacter aporrectodeae subsp. tuberculatae]|uniref:Fic family protein n=1 Tax=Verminephrobacter aporrectodeae TaxID=1110389 RepID=UPI0022431640|nr:Fic family protein [Verminephrobacter aporrectodeae]MCW8207354.1 Fic family protein [Verminephrobacter aporrectodeae subsp. tuberculatae]